MFFQKCLLALACSVFVSLGMSRGFTNLERSYNEGIDSILAVHDCESELRGHKIYGEFIDSLQGIGRRMRAMAKQSEERLVAVGGFDSYFLLHSVDDTTPSALDFLSKQLYKTFLRQSNYDSLRKSVESRSGNEAEKHLMLCVLDTVAEFVKENARHIALNSIWDAMTGESKALSFAEERDKRKIKDLTTELQELIKDFSSKVSSRRSATYDLSFE